MQEPGKEGSRDWEGTPRHVTEEKEQRQAGREERRQEGLSESYTSDQKPVRQQIPNRALRVNRSVPSS